MAKLHHLTSKLPSSLRNKNSFQNHHLYCWMGVQVILEILGNILPQKYNKIPNILPQTRNITPQK